MKQQQIDFFCYPEYNTEIKQLEFRRFDFIHILIISEHESWLDD